MNPIARVRDSKNLTKTLLAVVALLTAAVQDPTIHPLIFGLISAHPQIASVIGGIATLLALIHDPNPKPKGN